MTRRSPIDTATVTLSADQARRLALDAQGLIGQVFGVSVATVERAPLSRRRIATQSVLHHLGAIQLDTISVLARSHELVPYARVGAIGRAAVDTALWSDTSDGSPASTFEYWSHAACVLPADLWPWFAFRRRHYQRRGERWHAVPRNALESLRRRLRDDGPLTTADVGGAKRTSEWWDWSEAKVGLEWLLDIGDVVVTQRVGWRRVYDLPERALDTGVLTQAGVGSATWSSTDGIEGPTDEECVRHLVILGARAMGIGTMSDILDVHRLSGRYTGRTHITRLFTDLVDEGILTAVDVRGWGALAYADSALLNRAATRGRHRTTLLSPFDSLVWHRGRTERVFGFDYQLEAYVPAAQRVYGYFTMPVLHGGRLVARVDPKRDKGVLRARTVTFETSDGPGAPNGSVPADAVRGTAAALVEAARWVGCESVAVDTVRPASAKASLVAAVSRQ